MHEVYLVWELVPDDTQVYHLVLLTDQDFERIKSCHGHFKNGGIQSEEVSDNLSWLNEYLATKPESKIHPDSPPTKVNGLLVVCGWIL